MVRNLLLAAGALVALSVFASAQGQFGNAAEAKAMLEKAVAELKSNEGAALAKFNKGEGGFKDRDLYVFCYDMASAKFTAHVNQSLLGTDVKALKEKGRLGSRRKSLQCDEAGNNFYCKLQFPEARHHRTGSQGVHTSPRLATKAAALATTNDASLRPPPAASLFRVCCACSGRPATSHHATNGRFRS